MSIKIQNLQFGFKKKILDTPLNLEISRGSLVAILGPNGIGKTTLLKTILGLYQPLAGGIFLEDRNIESFSSKELATKISALLTEKIVIDYCIVKEFIELGNFPHKNLPLTFLEIVEYFNLNHLLDQFFQNLSDGQKQKVMLARTAYQSLQFMILDEPTTHLDPKNKKELFRILKRLTTEKNSGILLATHDLDLALEFTNEIWLFDEEGNLHHGSPEEIKSSGLLEKIFAL